MSRIRTVKPELFTSATVARVSHAARLTFVGLWTHADDHGRCRDDARLIKGALWPLEDDVTYVHVAAHLDELAGVGLICRYAAGGKRYLHVTSWEEHQKVTHPSKPKCPECPRAAHGGSAESSWDLKTSSGDLTPEVEVEVEVEQGSEVPPSAGRAAPANDPPRLTVVDGQAGEPDPPPPDERPVTAQPLIAGFVERCRRRPPGNYLKRLGDGVKQHLAEGVPPDVLAEALEIIRVKALQPGALPGCVQEILNPPEPRRGTQRASPPGTSGDTYDYLRDRYAQAQASKGG